MAHTRLAALLAVALCIAHGAASVADVESAAEAAGAAFLARFSRARPHASPLAPRALGDATEGAWFQGRMDMDMLMGVPTAVFAARESGGRALAGHALGASSMHAIHRMAATLHVDFPGESDVDGMHVQVHVPAHTAAAQLYGSSLLNAPVQGFLENGTLHVSPDIDPVCELVSVPARELAAALAAAPMRRLRAADAVTLVVSGARRRLATAAHGVFAAPDVRALQAAPLDGAALDAAAGGRAQPPLLFDTAAVRELSGGGVADGNDLVSTHMCRIGDRFQPFADASQAVAALEDDVVLAGAGQRVLAGVPLTRRLHRRLRELDPSAVAAAAPSLARRLYLDAAVSRGTRNVLVVRLVFNGQSEANAVNATLLAENMHNIMGELNRSASGAAAFSFELLPKVVLADALAPCTDDVYAMRAAVEAELAANFTGIVVGDTHQHVCIVLNYCAFDWAGMAYVSGSISWINGVNWFMVPATLHELGHNLGLDHASRVNPLTGVWTEYYDDDDYMSASSTPANTRDYAAGFKHDMGYIDDAAVATAGSRVGDTQGVLAVAAVDAGVMVRPAEHNGTFATLRFRHPGMFVARHEDRFVYATLRARSQTSPRGVRLNELPFAMNYAGNTRLTDVTPFTPSQQDAALQVGASYVQPAMEGNFLLENLGSLPPLNSSTGASVPRVALRVSPLRATNATPAAEVFIPDVMRGCVGASCQPRAVPLLKEINCSNNASAVVEFTLPGTDLGYATIVGVLVPALATSRLGGALPAPVAVLAHVCSLDSARFATSAAGFDVLPLVEALTDADLTRDGVAAHPASRQLNASTGAWSHCWRVPVYAAPGGSPAFVALKAALLPAGTRFATFSEASAPAMQVTLTCAVPTLASGDAQVQPFGAATNAVLLHKLYLSFGGGGLDGVYAIKAGEPMYNGAPVYNLPGVADIRWTASGWKRFVQDSLTFVYPACGSALDAAKNLAALTTFGTCAFRALPVCTGNSFYNVTSGGCHACPAHAIAMAGAQATTPSAVASVCTCRAGWFMDAAVQCAPCTAGTFKEVPGNSASDAFSGCLACPSGYTSTPGSTRCTPTPSAFADGGAASAALGSVDACTSFFIVGWGSYYSGVYRLLEGTSVRGRVVYEMFTPNNATTGMYAIYQPAYSAWYFTGDIHMTWYYRRILNSARSPSAWDTAEFGAAYPDAFAGCHCSAPAQVGCTCPPGSGRASATSACVRCPAATYASGYPVSRNEVVSTCTSCPTGLRHEGVGMVDVAACSVVTCSAFDVAWQSTSTVPNIFYGMYRRVPGTSYTAWQHVTNTVFMYKPVGSTRAYLDNDMVTSAYYGYATDRSPYPWTAAEWSLYAGNGVWISATPVLTCMECMNGFVFNASTGRCDACVAGTTTLPGVEAATACTVCALGYTRTATGACVACPVNTFSNSLDAATCTACTPPWSTLGATGQSSCAPPLDAALVTVCGDAAWYDPRAAACSACPAGLRRVADAEGVQPPASACGCPFGFVAVDSRRCLPPAVVTITPSSTVAASAVWAGEYRACAPVTPRVAALHWQLVSNVSSLVAPDLPPRILSYVSNCPNSSSCTGPRWQITSDAPVGASWAQYAYVRQTSLRANGSGLWPTLVRGARTTSVGMLPAQQQVWQAFERWPIGFHDVSVELTPSAWAVAEDTPLPACGFVTGATSYDAVYGATTLAREVPSPTPTATPSPSLTGTPTPSPSVTPSATATPSNSPTASMSSSVTTSPSMTPSASNSATPSASGSVTSTSTASYTPSSSSTGTLTLTASPTATASHTASATGTGSSSATRSPSSTRTPSTTSDKPPSASRTALPSVSSVASLVAGSATPRAPASLSLSLVFTLLIRIAPQERVPNVEDAVSRMCIAALTALPRVDARAQRFNVSCDSARATWRRASASASLRRLVDEAGVDCDPSTDTSAACQLVGFDMSLAIRDELHAQVDATPPQLSADTFAEQYRLVQYLADNVDIVVANIQTAMTASGTTSVEQSVAEWLATASATLSVQPLRVVALAAAPSSSAVAENVRSDDRALPLGIVIGAAAGGVALIVLVIAALLMLRPKKPKPPVLRSVASSARIRVVRAQGSGTTAAVPSGTTSPLRVYNRVQATGSFRQHSFDPLRV